MSYAEHALRTLILHDWEDAGEWASALTALSDVTDAQLDERVRSEIDSPAKRVHGSRTSPPINFSKLHKVAGGV